MNSYLVHGMAQVTYDVRASSALSGTVTAAAAAIALVMDYMLWLS